MSDDILVQAREAYDRASTWWADNHAEAKDDLRFARLGEQWPQNIKQKRDLEHRPCETFNKMPSFIRQVVNDARQNKPSIKVHPQDSGADPRVAEILDGLVRNIEATSDADIAYDTAIEDAVSTGFGFWRINTAYACDDSFDQDIVIERVSNQFTVLGDPNSQSADSSDWNEAFVVTTMTQSEFERAYPKAEKVDWDTDFRDCPGWLEGDNVVVAEYWTREKVASEIVLLSDGSIVKAEDMANEPERFAGLEVIGSRETETYKVTQRIMSGAEVLKKVDWPGKYIPIVPVYGDEVVDEDGKRHFRSLIRDAKGSQRMYNYMRNTGIEMIALAPKVPYIGRKGAFDSDPNWATANDQSHPFLEYDGGDAPERQAAPSVPQGVLQEALNANDDMKSIIGIYDASLGARSNETSGRAIMARQREGDVSTFHFIDNLSRAIRHGGRIVLDLISKTYTTERMIRVLGEDLTPNTVKIAPTGQAVIEEETVEGEIPAAVFDLAAGKYDLTVSAGPSFTTRREEAALQMESFIQKVPEAAPLIGDLYAKSLDWPMAEDIAERLKRLVPPEALGEAEQGLPPEVQAQMEQGMAMIQQLQQELAQAQAQASDKAQENALKQREADIKEQQNEIEYYRAETERMQAQKPVMAPRAA